MAEELRERAAAALERRAALLRDPNTNAIRLVHGAADGLAGLVVEQLGPVLVAQLQAGILRLREQAVRDVCAYLMDAVGAEAVYRKEFPKDRSHRPADLDARLRDPEPWIGTPAEAEFTVSEGGLRFLVRPYDGYATGLFLDHRLHRARVRELAAGRAVLNGFAYTCGFAVAAAAGGAGRTANVDASKKYLEWGKRNLTQNDVPLADQRFYCSDMLDFAARARRQSLRFDYVILDPPTFGRTKKPPRVFALKEDLSQLLESSITLLNTGGYLQVSINHRPWAGRLRQLVRGACQAVGRRCRLLDEPPVPPDFPDDPGFSKAVLAEL